jgi:hypothetical protein
MELLLEAGESIGVSNFSQKKEEIILPYAIVIPAVDSVGGLVPFRWFAAGS